ncbi:4-amino-4-deoxychorismate lyase [Glaciihabitans tibetensis]|uniref:4-amino-4-deoxychorismate lyase n=1 Tax=Glaciihabitans tibetensis TaxID=1266600 RepID=A0A2T0VHH0_9MICO|nr:aminotransferase class IV [Glaciihabitans tibetensis]PRY69667.1 4-amino-4-deoxychorismate lyase [Glaciihabitans tibetensis]
MSRTVLAVLNRPSNSAAPRDPAAPLFSFADPLRPQLNVQDLGVTRGDGIFESISVVRGIPHALEAHLARFTHSAEVLELPAPDLATWRQAIRAVVERLDPVAEGFVRAVLTRGVEGDARPTGWVFASVSTDHSVARTRGVRVVLLDRGLRHDVGRTSPWLLSGAKTLSYAVNRAALREAARRNADDVLFVSSDGFVLEGPTSSLIYLRDGQLRTPATESGILEGTTQGDAFQWARQRGLGTGFELLTPIELGHTDAAWLVSSGRLAVPIRVLDGRPHPVRADMTADLNGYLLTREASVG